MSFTYAQSTFSVKVSVTPEFIEEESSINDDYYFWKYTVLIENKSKNILKLLNRSWVIINNIGNKEEVSGPGVVGVQPIIQPDESFEYNSFVQLNTPSGMMLGHYEMKKSDDSIIQIKIPSFALDSPHELILPN